jgi:hypothetical protein
MSTAPRIESELARRYQIRIETAADGVGVVHVVDVEAITPEHRDGAILFSAHTRDAADELVAAIGKRTTDGDGWVLRQYWSGGLREHGELSARVAREYCRVLGERGASWD